VCQVPTGVKRIECARSPPATKGLSAGWATDLLVDLPLVGWRLFLSEMLLDDPPVKEMRSQRT
jgi:hypothetical protein